jgi:hypothetical protein
MPSALTRARLVSDKQLDLDKHRGMAEQKATDIRRILADVEKSSGQGALAVRLGGPELRRWLRRRVRTAPLAAPVDLTAFAISDRDMALLLKQLRADDADRGTRL